MSISHPPFFQVDPNQELVAQGAANIFGSMMSSLPVSSSLSRSMVQEESGCRSLLTSLTSCLCLLVVLLWVGPVFEPLPVCVLSSMIVVSLKGVMKKVTEFKVRTSSCRLGLLLALVSALGLLDQIL